VYHAALLVSETGDIGSDPAVLGKGVEPRNVFMAAFFAAGGKNIQCAVLTSKLNVTWRPTM